MADIDPGSVFTFVSPSTGETVVAVTCQAAAEALSVSPVTVKRAIKRGRLPGEQVFGRWFAERDAVELASVAGWTATTGITMGRPRKKPRKKRPTAPRHLLG